MAKFAHANTIDNGLNNVKSNGTRVLLLKAYTFGDDYATVTGNSIVEYTVTTTDFTLTTETASARRVAVTAQSGNTASSDSGGTPDLHIAVTNGVDEVILVTDETSDQVVTSGNPVSIPTFYYQVSQPS